MSLKGWNNGEKGEVVKFILESNFKLLGRHLPHNILAITSNERSALSSDYLSDGLVVFDTDLEEWVQYKNGKWIKKSSNAETFILDIALTDWVDKEIYIPFDVHGILNPTAQMFIQNGGKYISVIGGVSVDLDNGIILNTDMPFAGKVVVK